MNSNSSLPHGQWTNKDGKVCCLIISLIQHNLVPGLETHLNLYLIGFVHLFYQMFWARTWWKCLQWRQPDSLNIAGIGSQSVFIEGIYNTPLLPLCLYVPKSPLFYPLPYYKLGHYVSILNVDLPKTVILTTLISQLWQSWIPSVRDRGYSLREGVNLTKKMWEF